MGTTDGMKVAAIDVGSNSIHMVIAQVEADGRFTVLDRAKEMVGLGRRTLNNGRLARDTIRAGIDTLAAFRTLAQRHGVTRFKAVATSAVREASNGGDFLRQVEQQLGLRVKVIPGEEEARLIYCGVRHAIDLRGEPRLLVDIGGGSVELVLVSDDRPVALHSLKLGVARLTERFFKDDPPEPKQVGRFQQCLAEELDPVLESVRQYGPRQVIGTSGTILTLVNMVACQRGAAPDGRLNHFAVTAEEIARLRRTLVKSDRDERLSMKGLDEKRADLIVAGALLADHILQGAGACELVACTWALREGLLLDFIGRHRKGIEEMERFSDPRRCSVVRFARHVGETGPHGPHVAALALQIFDQLAGEFELPAEAREWLEYAALLHDVGHHLSHDHHHRHSYYMIRNGDLLGFRHEEIEILAQVARYHQKAPPKSSDEGYNSLSARSREIVRVLSAILRVADALDRSHFSIVQEVRINRRGKAVTAQLFTDGKDAALELWETRNRAGLLERVLGRPVEFRIAARQPAAASPHAAQRLRFAPRTAASR